MTAGLVRLRFVAMGAAAVGIVGTALIVLAAVALACTSIMAAMTISPTGGTFGKSTVVKSSVTGGMKPGPAKYALHITKGLTTSSGGADCMSFTGVITLKTITPNSSGGWSVNVTIPGTLKRGAHGICAIETSPTKGFTGTQHDTFTIT